MPPSSSSFSFWPLCRLGRWCILVEQIGPRTVGHTSILQHLFKLAWQQMHGANFVKKCLSFCRRSNVFRSCTVPSRNVNTPHNSTKAVHHFVAGVQEFELVRSSFRSNVVQTVSFLSVRAKCTFDPSFVRVPGFFGGHAFANKRWLRPF